MNTVSNSLKEGIDYLTEVQVPEAEMSASSLLSFVMKRPRLSIYIDQDITLNPVQEKEYNLLLKKRAERYPLQYLLKSIPFRNVLLEVGEGCLIPRPETELLVESVLTKLDQSKKLAILDLATGSGNIAISLAGEAPNWNLYASDISYIAIDYAKKNAEQNQVSNRIQFVTSNLFEHITGSFDAIVSNPPYLKTAEMEQAQAELHYEPSLALDGGIDGLHFYRMIISGAKLFLKKDGFLFFEIGYDQAEQVSKLMVDNQFESIELINDYAGLKRIISGRLVNHG